MINPRESILNPFQDTGYTSNFNFRWPDQQMFSPGDKVIHVSTGQIMTIRYCVNSVSRTRRVSNCNWFTVKENGVTFPDYLLSPVPKEYWYGYPI